jgi:hypothetical protein
MGQAQKYLTAPSNPCARALTRGSVIFSSCKRACAKPRSRISCAFIQRPASIMLAAADHRMSTCCRCSSTGWRMAAHLKISPSSNSRQYCPSRSTAHCCFASGRPGRITRRAIPGAQPASYAHHEAAAKPQFCCRATRLRDGIYIQEFQFPERASLDRYTRF